MFRLDFPLEILRQDAREGDLVLDPFCGRGTTNFAARLLGLSSLGVDSSPVAIAIAASKLVSTTPKEIVECAHSILEDSESDHHPDSEFWRWAFHPTVLKDICRLRSSLLHECSTAERIALRGIILGSLHGPKQAAIKSYFSNQSPRTYAPKPAYATRFWRERNMQPEEVHILEIIERKAKRYYGNLPTCTSLARLADSRNTTALEPHNPGSRFNWVITSPPYYGMRTYLADQWLRNWFLGGPDYVEYGNQNQIEHSSPEAFAADLQRVWLNASAVCSDDARLIVRFGGISDRRVEPLSIIRHSLNSSPWRITAIRSAGSASNGKRQADTFLRKKTTPKTEHDVWATLN